MAYDSTTSNSRASKTTAMPNAAPTKPNAAPPTTTSEAKDDQSAGYSRSDKIALGCGIGIGLPAAIVGIVACLRHR